MKRYSRALLALLLSLAAFFLLVACPTDTEQRETVLDIPINKNNDSLLTFDTLIIKVYSKDSSFVQEVFHGRLTDPKKLLDIPLDARVGREFTVSIIGYKGGKLGMHQEVTILNLKPSGTKDLPVKDTVQIEPVIPEIVTGDTSTAEGDSLRLPITVRNPWGTGATMTLKEALPGAALDTAGLGTGYCHFTWRPNHGQGRAEPYTVTIVYASAARRIEKAVAIKVKNINRPPKMARLSNTAVNEGDPMDFPVEATDPDGDSLVFSLDSMPKGAMLSKGRFTWKTSAGEVGNHFLIFRVTDGTASDSQAVILSVGAVDRPPMITGIVDTTAKEYDSLNLEIAATDPDGKPITLRVVGLPDSAKYSALGSPSGKGRIVWKIKGNQSRVEPYVITVFATDGQIESRADIKILVLDVPRTIHVAITAPTSELITNQKTVQVEWTANGVAQPKTQDTLKVEGPNRITRTFYDGDGNSGSATITVYRDTVLPGKPGLTGPLYSKDVPKVTWPEVEVGAIYDYRFIRTGGTTPIAKNTTTGRSFPPDGSLAPTVTSGEHRLFVKTVDRAGNAGPETEYRVVIDLVNPVVAILAPTDMGRTTSLDPVISGTASDNLGLASLTYSVKDSTPKPLSVANGKWSLDGLRFSEGPNKVVITAKDSAGRDTSASILITKLPNVVFVREGAKGSGTSWEDALADLDLALNTAYLAKYVAGTQIWMTAGDYPRSTGSSLSMKSDLSIIGGFSKVKPQASASARDTTDGRSRFFIPNGSALSDLFRVREFDPNNYEGKPVKNVAFDGLDFMSRDANGIMIPGAEGVVFKNCGFNNSPYVFVVIQIDSSTVEFQDCQFIGNSSLLPVVIDNKNKSVTFNRCLFQNNTSQEAGAIQALSGNILVQNSTFKNNTIQVQIMEETVKALRHISVTAPAALSMRNCVIQGLNSNPTSITDQNGSPVSVDASNTHID